MSSVNTKVKYPPIHNCLIFASPNGRSFTSENVGGVILSETGEYITLYLEKQGSALLIEKLNS